MRLVHARSIGRGADDLRPRPGRCVPSTPTRPSRARDRTWIARLPPHRTRKRGPSRWPHSFATGSTNAWAAASFSCSTTCRSSGAAPLPPACSRLSVARGRPSSITCFPRELSRRSRWSVCVVAARCCRSTQRRWPSRRPKSESCSPPSSAPTSSLRRFTSSRQAGRPRCDSQSRRCEGRRPRNVRTSCGACPGQAAASSTTSPRRLCRRGHAGPRAGAGRSTPRSLHARALR